jgi:hypothetical protein
LRAFELAKPAPIYSKCETVREGPKVHGMGVVIDGDGVHEKEIHRKVSTVRVDLARRLKRHAIARRDALVRQHGSLEAALKFLYDIRRGKAAHADQSAAEYDHFDDLADLAADSELVRFAARVALEKVWA